ncbi:MAG: NAD(P)H-hydrate epimerase, partial [Promethearchaeota archaeon]
MLDETISSAEMARRDRNSAWWGVPGELLMENAGRSVAEYIVGKLEPVKGKVVTIFCGTGNNGGDGFVAARHLASAGVIVQVILCGNQANFRTTLAEENWSRVARFPSVKTRECRTPDQFESAFSEFRGSDAFVDAMLGTGIRGKVREPVATAIKAFNGVDPSHTLKVAVDLPSGLDPDTGRVPDVAVKAKVVVTFHRLKSGLERAVSDGLVEEVVVRRIGIPVEAVEYIGPGDVLRYYHPRPRSAHKGDFGKVLVVGGSAKYSGAPALTALGALRAGADLVNCIVPSSVAGVVRGFSPALIVTPVAGDYLSEETVSTCDMLFDWADAVVIGPGGSAEQVAIDGLKKAIEMAIQRDLAMVVDADGLRALRSFEGRLKNKRVIATPHAGEFHS